MDIIAIERIRVNGRHGADPGERDREQPFDIDIEIELDADAASRSDDLAQTINYAAVHARVVKVVSSTSFDLLERLAREILEAAVFVEPAAVRGRVRIAKPQLLAGATASVTLARENPGRGAAGE